MTQSFPFARANSLGWSPGQRLTAAQANTIDANAAQAADGTLWSDVTFLKNAREHVLTQTTPCIVWNGHARWWMIPGPSSGAPGNPTLLISEDGGETYSAQSVTAGTNWNATWSIATDGAGTVVMGGGGGSATASKIRQSTTEGAGGTWNARNTNASGTEAVTAMCWHAAAGLFIAGLSSSSTTNIETSPTGQTWTQRTAPNSNPRMAIVSNGTIAVALGGDRALSTTTSSVITSTDGITWTSRALPFTSTWTSLAWSSTLGKFMAIGHGVIAISTDGITWTSPIVSGAPFSTGVPQLGAHGRFWIAGVLYDSLFVAGSPTHALIYSANDGVTWSLVKVTLAAICDGRGIDSNGEQLVSVGNSQASVSLVSGS